MKKRILSLALLLCTAIASADVYVDSILVKTCNAGGLDTVYDFDIPELTKTPNGYKASFIEHYGRHGSRYAYSQRYYSSLHEALERGAAAGVLTDFGRELKTRFDKHYKTYTLNMGDLSPLGWEQQQRIARTMYTNFKSAFPKGATVYASASGSTRSIMSMSSFCLGLQQMDSNLPIVEHTGRLYLRATMPRDSKNPLPIARKPRPLQMTETLDHFQDRKLDYRQILGKLFTDIDAACGTGMDQRDFVRRLYVLVAGMESIPEEQRTDFTGLFTEEEYARMWLIDNYKRYLEYYVYLPKCKEVVDDIIEDADRRLAGMNSGATLRFGHDHVILPICEAISVDGYGTQPSSPDEVARTFQSWTSPMGTNLQFIFYLPTGKSGSESRPVLFKVLRNGREARLDGLSTDNFPYYRWEDFKRWFK